VSQTTTLPGAPTILKKSEQTQNWPLKWQEKSAQNMNDGEYKINTLKKQHVSKGKGVIAHIWA
jgi:hypothetical protein